MTYITCHQLRSINSVSVSQSSVVQINVMKPKEEFAINQEYLTFLCMSIIWYNRIGHSIV